MHITKFHCTGQFTNIENQPIQSTMQSYAKPCKINEINKKHQHLKNYWLPHISAILHASKRRQTDTCKIVSNVCKF